MATLDNKYGFLLNIFIKYFLTLYDTYDESIKPICVHKTNLCPIIDWVRNELLKFYKFVNSKKGQNSINLGTEQGKINIQ